MKAAALRLHLALPLLAALAAALETRSGWAPHHRLRAPLPSYYAALRHRRAAEQERSAEATRRRALAIPAVAAPAEKAPLAGDHLAGFPAAAVFVINLDEHSYGFRGFLAHTSRSLGIPSSAIVRSPGVVAGDRTLDGRWAQSLIPGMTFARRGHRGALGLGLAHLSAWQHVAAAKGCQGDAAKSSYALVFEDDERVDDDFAKQLGGIIALAKNASRPPDFVNLNVLRPTGTPVGKVGRAHLLKVGKHKEVGRRPNVWGSVYLMRCGSAEKLIDEVKHMRYYGALWDGVNPLMDVLIQDLFSRQQDKLTEWVVSPSQAISYHSEATSIRQAIDKTNKPPSQLFR